jgi:NAD(P)-dependent dehydrogenase (short-subunit alcohol dehydrogenase family)
MTAERNFDVLLLGAAGSSGRFVARELADRGLSVFLAGRRPEPLAALAGELSASGAEVDSVVVDVIDPVGVRAAAARVRLVVTTVGPFVRFGAAVLDACLDVEVNYVDIANELMAVRAVLERDAQARTRGITAVTGAGFGPGGSESLVLDLVEELGETPDLVRVATAPAKGRVSPGVRETVAVLLPEGAITYVGGSLVRAPLGTGAAVLEFGGVRRAMLPGPAGDLEVARLASGAANVSAYFADPAQRVDDDGLSYAYAEVVAGSGRRLAAEARVGDGMRAGAAYAAEVARRILVGASAGAFTPGRLFGKDLFAAVTGSTRTSVPIGPV